MIRPTMEADTMTRDEVILSMENYIHSFLKDRIYRNHPDYDDLVQDCWIGIILAVDRLDTSKAKLTTYAMFHLRDRYKRWAYHKAKHSAIDDKVPLEEDLEWCKSPSETKAASLIMDFERKLEKLTDNERSVLNLTVAGYTYTEICKILNLGMSGVNYLLRKVRETLKK
jgi:RNA polymerase sigma factor (sigma-70 family)